RLGVRYRGAGEEDAVARARPEQVGRHPARAGPVDVGRRLRDAVGGAVLQLVAEAAGVEEGRGVRLLLGLRPLDLLEQEAVLPDPLAVEEGVGARGAEAAGRVQEEPAEDGRAGA